MKKLAVLMPTYNCAKYLQESIDSVLHQTFSDFDFFIFDDCSTDNTKEIILSYKDNRIFYRKNATNLGIAKTLNLGLEELLPNYDYISRMDADDWCFPQRFEKQLEHLENNPKTVFCGTQGYWLKDMELNPKKGWTYTTHSTYIQYYLLFSATFGHSSIVLRSQSFIDFDLKYDETVETCEDWELWVRVVKVGEMINLPDFLMKYRVLENSNHRSPDKIEIHLLERSRIISNYWQSFNIDWSPEQVFEYYYDTSIGVNHHFYSKLKNIIDSFNILFSNYAQTLEIQDKNQFSYLLSRRVLDFWKRSNFSRINLIVWFVILRRVQFMNKLKLIRSLIN